MENLVTLLSTSPILIHDFLPTAHGSTMNCVISLWPLSLRAFHFTCTNYLRAPGNPPSFGGAWDSLRTEDRIREGLWSKEPEGLHPTGWSPPDWNIARSWALQLFCLSLRRCSPKTCLNSLILALTKILICLGMGELETWGAPASVDSHLSSSKASPPLSFQNSSITVYFVIPCLLVFFLNPF